MKANPFLVSMVAIGAILFFGGGVLVALALNAMQSAFDSSQLAPWSLALTVGPFLAGAGLTLLFTSWVIAAAKWQRS